jgi:two-component system phosphate regulon response regulator OmpR
MIITDTPMHIAVVEDHNALRTIFRDHLLNDGYSVFAGACAEDLDEHVAKHRLDLLILDLNLPGENGISIARRYRKAYPTLQILMLTVKAETADKIRGYESGADLYLPKPVSAEELSAAVKSIARRVTFIESQDSAPRLDLAKKKVMYNLLTVDLSSNEIKIMKGLIEATDYLLEYWQLMELLGLEPTDKNKLNLGVYIHRLNKKLACVGVPEPGIKALWKVGYQLTEKFHIESKR